VAKKQKIRALQERVAEGNVVKSILAAVIAIALLPTLIAGAQEASTQQGEAGEPRAPKISDIMAQQQMRHIKLWFAGRGDNWPLADYEIDALKDGFDDLNAMLGGDTVEKAVGAPIAAIEKAIEAKDRPAFTAAFDNLTAGCNGCHRALDHGFIVIQRPTSPPLTNQIFAPQK
jgi:hypothetical protein